MEVTPGRESDSIDDVTTDSASDELDVLRALVIRLTSERDSALAENDQLRHLLKQFQRAQFGRRSEQLDGDQMQLGLDIETSFVARNTESDEKEAADAPAQQRKRRINRGALPAYLPRVHVKIAPDSTVCPCCRGTMHVIGEDKTERLDKVPAQYRVIVTHRPKYGCRACEGAVVQAPAPERLIKNGMPTEGLVATVVVDKYAWHMPLYRQAQMMALQGLPVDRATLAFWVATAAAELQPIYARMKELLLGSAKIAVDETRAPVLDPGRGRTKTGYLWAISRDNRPWGGTDPPGVVYTYAPGRGAEHAMALLAGYSGIVQCDGYAVYKQLTKPGREGGAVTLAFCWSHWRRQFFDIDHGGPAPIAREALERIAALYAIENRIRGCSAEERRAVRQAETKPLVEKLKAWLEDRLRAVSEKSTIAEAIRYGFNHWDGLVRFLADGRIEMDTNSVERAMRPIALNRKNSLFAGHDDGAVNWACLASLIETCKLNDVDPQTYLADVLSKLVNLWPTSRLDELLPWAWRASNPIASLEKVAA